MSTQERECKITIIQSTNPNYIQVANTIIEESQKTQKALNRNGE